MPNFLDEMLNPKSIAIYGASTPMKMATMQASSIIGGGFPGKVHYIHPHQDRVLGQKAYRKATDVSEPIDLALIVIPAPAVPEVLLDLAQKGTRYVVVTSGGFEEIGTKDGLSLNQKIRAIAGEHKMRMIGPNCLGLVNAHLPLNTTTFEAVLKPGPLSIASHSGSYATQIFPYMDTLEPGLGLRYVLSLGNEADVDVVDALECFKDDEKTGVIALYLEGIRRGRDFMRAAREASLKKPVIAHYVGGNQAGARAGGSHTAAIGTSQLVMEGLFRQCGIVPADGIGEIFDFARVLSQSPPMKGDRVAVITNSGGPGASAAFTLEKIGLRVPEFSEGFKQKILANMPNTGSANNPVDFTFDTDFNRFKDTIRFILKSDEVDAVLAYGLFAGGFFESRKNTYEKFFPGLNFDPAIQMATALVSAVAKIPSQENKPMIMSSMAAQNESGFLAFTEAKSPAYPTPERAARAIAALHRYWAWRIKQEKAEN